MQPSKKTPIILLFSTLVLFGACKKELSFDKWKPDLLAPLVKSTLQVKDVAQLDNRSWTQTVPSADIGYMPFVEVDVPELDIPLVGPYPYTLSDVVTFIDVDTADFRISFMNRYPITIATGTQIVFRTSASASSESNVILRHTVSRDIVPDSEYVIDTLLTNKTIRSDIYLSIEHFKSPGGQFITFSSQPTEISFEIRFLSVYTVGLKTNNMMEIADSADLESWDSQDDYDDSTAMGKLSLYFTNSLPINVHFQLYFFDEGYSMLLDSIYTGSGSMYAPGGQTDAQGEPIGTPQENRYDITLTESRLSRIRSARHIVYRLAGDTYGYSGSEVVVGGNCDLKLQAVGDLKIAISKLFN